MINLLLFYKMNKTKKNSQLNNSKPSTYVPKYKTRVNNTVLDINLLKNQEIAIMKHVLSYYDSHIKVETHSQDGIFTGIFRKLLTGEQIFKTYFKGTQDKNQITLSHYLNCQILPIILKPNESYIVSNESLMAYSSNLYFSTDTKFKNILVGEGIHQVMLTNKTNLNGIIWLAAIGGYSKINLKPGDDVKIAQGLFLASDNRINFEVSTLGGVKSFLFGATSSLMRFKGPLTLYIHNTNHNYFVETLHHKLQKYSDYNKSNHTGYNINKSNRTVNKTINKTIIKK